MNSSDHLQVKLKFKVSSLFYTAEQIYKVHGLKGQRSHKQTQTLTFFAQMAQSDIFFASNDSFEIFSWTKLVSYASEIQTSCKEKQNYTINNHIDKNRRRRPATKTHKTIRKAVIHSETQIKKIDREEHKEYKHKLTRRRKTTITKRQNICKERPDLLLCHYPTIIVSNIYIYSDCKSAITINVNGIGMFTSLQSTIYVILLYNTFKGRSIFYPIYESVLSICH